MMNISLLLYFMWPRYFSFDFVLNLLMLSGVCAEVDTCKCDFGYYGLNCQRKCDCSGHSECDGMSCLQCFNNTLG